MRTALSFSGGKDAWACLWLYEDRLSEIDVIWVNTGKAYPETLAQVAHAKSLCSRFHEVMVDRDAQNEREGIPSDLVPVEHTRYGQIAVGGSGQRVQSSLGCHFDNIILPLTQKALDLGITHLVRGVKVKDSHVTQVRSGDALNGLTFIHPIEDWSDADVLNYLHTKMTVPEHFHLPTSSLDCYDCTAFLEDVGPQIEWARRTHPDLLEAFDARLSLLRDAIKGPYAALGKVSHAGL